MQDNEIQICLVGESLTGKSTFVTNLMQSENLPKSEIGLALQRHKLKRSLMGQSLTITIWDTDSNSENDGQRKLVVDDCEIVLIFFDVSNIISFECVGRWISYVNRHNLKALKCLVANKTDLQSLISIQRMESIAQANNMKIFFCNHQSDTNAVFSSILSNYIGHTDYIKIQKQYETNKANKGWFLQRMFGGGVDESKIKQLKEIKLNYQKRFEAVVEQMEGEHKKSLSSIREELQNTYQRCSGVSLRSSVSKESKQLSISDIINLMGKRMQEINAQNNALTQENLNLKQSLVSQGKTNKVMQSSQNDYVQKINELSKVCDQYKAEQLHWNEQKKKLNMTVDLMMTDNKKLKEQLRHLKEQLHKSKQDNKLEEARQSMEYNIEIEQRLFQKETEQIFFECRSLIGFIKITQKSRISVILKSILEDRSRLCLTAAKRLYEFEEQKKASPIQKIQGKSNLLFVISLIKEAKIILIYLPNQFDRGSKAKEGFIVVIDEIEVRCYLAQPAGIKYFWSFTPLNISFLDYELIFDHSNGVIKTRQQSKNCLKLVSREYLDSPNKIESPDKEQISIGALMGSPLIESSNIRLKNTKSCEFPRKSIIGRESARYEQNFTFQILELTLVSSQNQPF